MNEDINKPRVHPDLYEGLSEPDRRAADLLASARFADDRVKDRVKLAVLSARNLPGRNFRIIVLLRVMCSRTKFPIAVPEAYASRHPFCPQLHFRPSGTMLM